MSDAHAAPPTPTEWCHLRMWRCRKCELLRGAVGGDGAGIAAMRPARIAVEGNAIDRPVEQMCREWLQYVGGVSALTISQGSLAILR